MNPLLTTLAPERTASIFKTILCEERLLGALITLPPGRTIARFADPACDQVLFVVSGRVIVRREKLDVLLPPDSAYRVAAGSDVSLAADSDEGARFSIFNSPNRRQPSPRLWSWLPTLSPPPPEVVRFLPTPVTIMNSNPLYFTREDHSKLHLLLSLSSAPGRDQLRSELDRAVILEAGELPPEVVTMNSLVTFEDLSTGEVESYVLTFPERANVDEKRLSILAPVGTALIGYRKGDVVDWTMPGGQRRLRIHDVTQPTAVA